MSGLDDDTFGAPLDVALDPLEVTAAPRPERPLTRDEVLDELDSHLATVVHTAVEHLLVKTYPDNAPLEVIVASTKLRLKVLRERERGHARTTDNEGNEHG